MEGETAHAPRHLPVETLVWQGHTLAGEFTCAFPLMPRTNSYFCSWKNFTLNLSTMFTDLGHPIDVTLCLRCDSGQKSFVTIVSTSILT